METYRSNHFLDIDGNVHAKTCRTCGFVHDISPDGVCPRWAPEDYEIPWLGDVDRRADDDVEFCVEGE